MKKCIGIEAVSVSPRDFFLYDHGNVIVNDKVDNINNKCIDNWNDFCAYVYSKKDAEQYIEDAFIGNVHYKYNELKDKFVIDSVDTEELDPYGIKNVNFSLTTPSDDRWELYKKQRLENGFDESECWSLDWTIIKFMLPRIKLLKDIVFGYPARLNSEEEWIQILNKIIDALELVIETDYDCVEYYPHIYRTDEERKIAKDKYDRFKEGWNLLHEWFFSLGD